MHGQSRWEDTSLNLPQHSSQRHLNSHCPGNVDDQKAYLVSTDSHEQCSHSTKVLEHFSWEYQQSSPTHDNMLGKKSRQSPSQGHCSYHGQSNGDVMKAYLASTDGHEQCSSVGLGSSWRSDNCISSQPGY